VVEEELSEEAPKMEGAPMWMATFGDMMSLLLCFFVLLLSFANLDVVKFRDMLGSMKDAFGVQTQTAGEFAAHSTAPIELVETEKKSVIELDPQAVPPPKAKMDEELLEKVEKFIGASGLDGVVEAVPGERGVTIRTKGTLMFETASDTLRLEAAPVLNEIAQLAVRYDYQIAVEGHTDDVPIHTERFPSNWELSAARAVAGARYLIERGGVGPERVSATGRAHTRPLTRDATPQAKAKNRRLEFVFYHEEDLAGDRPVELEVPSPGTP